MNRSQILHLRALAYLRGTIRRIPQTVHLTPLLHGRQKLVHPAGYADLLPHHQRFQTVSCRFRLHQLVIRQLIGIFLPHEQGWNGTSSAGDDGDVRAVPKGLGFTASLSFGTVGTAAPLVSRVVAPLDDALGAGDVWRKLDFISEYCFLDSVFWDDVAGNFNARSFLQRNGMPRKNGIPQGSILDHLFSNYLNKSNLYEYNKANK